MNKPEIIRRITYAKFLLLQGNESLQSGVPIADGLAVSLFQDAAEMLLRSVAEYLDAEVIFSTPFDGIINKIEIAKLNKNQIKVSSKIAISQLNKSRVNFKHYGLLPTNEDARKFSRDIEIFFQRTVEDFLNLSYEDISLADIIKNDRIRNFAKLSEKCFYDLEFLMAILNSAKAFRLILNRTACSEEATKIHRPRDFDNRELTNVIKKLEKYATDHEIQLILLRHGVNLFDYVYFQHVSPYVGLTAANTFHVGDMPHLEDKDLKEAANFCVKFVVQSAIKVEQKQYFNKNRYMEKSEPEFIVKTTSEIIVYPFKSSENQPLEVIKIASKGDLLVGSHRRQDKENYIEIIHDGETAFILKDSVESIKKND